MLRHSRGRTVAGGSSEPGSQSLKNLRLQNFRTLAYISRLSSHLLIITNPSQLHKCYPRTPMNVDLKRFSQRAERRTTSSDWVSYEFIYTNEGILQTHSTGFFSTSINFFSGVPSIVPTSG